MNKKMSKQEGTVWMSRIYFLAFFAGAGIFIMMNIMDIVESKQISENDLDSALLMMVVMWSLGGVIVGLDYFERKKAEDKQQNQTGVNH